jgi:hypothetical protein
MEVRALGLLLDTLGRPAGDAPREMPPQSIAIGGRQGTRRVLGEQRRDLRAGDVRVDDAAPGRLRRPLGGGRASSAQKQGLGVDRERVWGSYDTRSKRHKCSACGLDGPLRAADQRAISDDRRTSPITQTGERIPVAIEDPARAYSWPVLGHPVKRR